MSNSFPASTLQAAHTVSIRNASPLEKSRVCGCFYCRSIYPSSEIKEWIKERSGERTALCPRCGIDSVIPDASGYPMTEEFLSAMYRRWFENTVE